MAVIQSGNSPVELTIDNTSNAARVSNYDTRGNFTGLKASYSASTVLKTTTAAGTGVFASIFGSTTKIVRVHRIIVCGTCATAAVYGDIIVKKMSAIGTGGTPVELVQVPKDSISGAGTASRVFYYTTLGTAGTLVGTVAAQQIFLPITGTPAVDVKPVVFDWTAQGMNEAPVLRGTGEGLELNFGTTTANAPTLTVTFEYSEE